MWTRSQYIRTLSEIDINFLIITEDTPLYQQLANKAYELYAQGLNFEQIGRILGVDGKTCKKALTYKIPIL